MKKCIYLLSCLITFYLAGMFHSRFLMLLFAAECLLYMIMFIQSRYFKKSLNLQLLPVSGDLRKNNHSKYEILVINKGKIPITRVKIKMVVSYRQQQVKQEAIVYGCAGTGENIRLSLNMSAGYCGLIDLWLDHVWVYDYLALFHPRVRLQSVTTAAIFPAEKAMLINASANGSHEHEIIEEFIAQPDRGDSLEVRQLREYIAGDSFRQIDWNLTARTNKLWSREYEKEQDQDLSLYLDWRSEETPMIGQMDAFYEALSALVLGLLKERMTIQVWWQSAGNDKTGQPAGLAYRTITQNGQFRELLYSLYQEPWPNKKNQALSTVNQAPEGWNGIWLDIKLQIFHNGKLIFRFTKENFAEDIGQQVISL